MMTVKIMDGNDTCVLAGCIRSSFEHTCSAFGENVFNKKFEAEDYLLCTFLVLAVPFRRHSGIGHILGIITECSSLTTESKHVDHMHLRLLRGT